MRFPGKFLNRLYLPKFFGTDLRFEVRCIREDGQVRRSFYKSIRHLRKKWGVLTRLNKSRYNILYGVALRSEQKNADRAVTLHVLWADLDVGGSKTHKTIDAAYASLTRFKHPPTIIVQSGHGLHAFWCLRFPVRISTELAKRTLRNLAKVVGGDMQCAEPRHLLRLPQTTNWKNQAKPKKCRVAILRQEARYRFSRLKKSLNVSKIAPKATFAKAPTNYFDFFSQYVSGLRKTSELQAIGLCPFHDDKHPSWSLRTTDGVWHCFGCGAAGNAVSFCHLRNIDLDQCPDERAAWEHRSLAIDRGGYVIWKCVSDAWRKIIISNFVVDWELENRVSDRIRLENRIFSGNIVTQTKKQIPIRLGNDEFCSNRTFYAALVREGGSQLWLNGRFTERIREASMLLSKAKITKTTMDFGFQSKPGDSSSPRTENDTFLTPTLKISRGGIRKTSSTQIDMESIEQARHLELKIVSARSRKKLLRHICNDLLNLQPRHITYPLLGLLGGSALTHFIDDKTRYALWLVGPSGSGKSFIAKFFQSFFGDFMREGRVVSWSSTPNSLQYLGYFFKDCIFLVDDYKPAMIRNEGPVVQFLQTYADFYGRGRLTSEIKARKEYFVRGLMLTTGEDVPSGHASVVARSLILSIKKRKPDLDRGRACRNNCTDYPGITARYIRYLLRQNNLRTRLHRDLMRAHEMFLEGIEREENGVRVARNLALNWLGFKWITRYFRVARAPIDVRVVRKEHLRNLFSLRTSMLNLIAQEQPAQVFVRTLSEAINTGVCHVPNIPSESFSRNENVVGFKEGRNDRYIYIFPQRAISLVRAEVHRLGQHFDWTPNALSKALETADMLITKPNRQDSAVRKRVGSKVYRVWKFRVECFEHGGNQ